MLWADEGAVVSQQSPSSKSMLDFKEISEMDRATSRAPADRLFCAIELSKKSRLLGIQFPDRQKASVFPLKGGDREGLMAKLVAACDRCTKVSGKEPSMILCYEAGYDATVCKSATWIVFLSIAARAMTDPRVSGNQN
jgi:hypothetical protein